MEPMIQVENLCKRFETKGGTVEAAKNISFSIEKGEIFGIIGLSGAGKSTLVRCLNLLERPTSGTVKVNGKNLTELSEKELRKERQKIGMIFQHFNLLMQRTALDNVCFPMEIAGIGKAEARKKALEYLRIVGLEEKALSYPSQLSGGQKQRVGIARALATDPSILLSDESTSALDPKTTKAILKLLKRINKELGITIVLITHEMNVIQSICHHVAVMESGRVVEKGNVLDVFGEPQQEITKNFVKTVINDSVPELLIESIRSEKKNNKLLKLKFLDSDSTESVLSGVNKKFDVETNILFANISEIQERVLGIIIVQIIGAKNEIEGAQKYFSEHGVGYKEIYI